MKKHLITIAIIAAFLALLGTPWHASAFGGFSPFSDSGGGGTGSGDVTGPTTPTAGSVPKWGPSGKALVDAFVLGTLTDGKWCTYTTALGIHCTSDQPAGATATAITVADNQTDTTEFPLLVGAATGDLGPRTRSTLTYNAVTGLLSSTLFSGALNGTVGATTPAAGAFTTLSSSGKSTLNNLSIGTNDNSTILADGDATFKGNLAAKSLGVTRGTAGQYAQFYEGTGGGNESISWGVADAVTDTYRANLPITAPASGQVMSFPTPTAGLTQGVWVTPHTFAETGALATGLISNTITTGALYASTGHDISKD